MGLKYSTSGKPNSRTMGMANVKLKLPITTVITLVFLFSIFPLNEVGFDIEYLHNRIWETKQQKRILSSQLFLFGYDYKQLWEVAYGMNPTVKETSSSNTVSLSISYILDCVKPNTFFEKISKCRIWPSMYLSLEFFHRMGRPESSSIQLKR